MMLFTVNIATYNQLDNLKIIMRALDRQTYKGSFQIIVCDDGSSDGTKEWAGLNSFEYYWQEDDGFRIAKSKNMGIKEAKGDYFISLEADVVPHFRLLEKYAERVKHNRIILGVRHDVEKFSNQLNYSHLDAGIVEYDWRMENLRNLKNVKNPWTLCSGCNVLFPTKKLQEIGGWNEDFKAYGIDDYEVCLRLMMAGCEITALPAAYGYHLKHEIRISPSENEEILRDLERKYYESRN